MKSKGFNIIEADNLRKKTGHTAGTIKERVDAIHKLLRDDNVDILLAYWGGANTNEILPHLDYELFKQYKKPIVGFSDTTALLLAVNKICNIKTYIGPSGITFDKPDPFEYTYEYFEKLLLNKESEILIKDSEYFADDLYFLRKDSDYRIKNRNEGRKVFSHGCIEAEIIAGNIQTLLVLAGTRFFPDLKGKVLFLEEEEGQGTDMIHRFFTHLSQVIDLNDLAGICIGRFCSQSGFSEDDSEEMIYNEVFKNLDIPIIYNLDFGHSDPMFTLPIGGKVLIDTKKNILKIIN